MKSTHFFSLFINGQFYSKNKLIELCQTKLEQSSLKDWEFAFYRFIAEWLDEKSSAIQVKTSGSTGIPKNILLEKDKMVTSAKMTLDFLKIKKEENALLSLSCNYIAGKMMVVRAMVGGLNLIPTAPSNNPLAALSAEQKVDFTAWVPFQLQHVLKQQELKNRVTDIKNILIGGAPVSFKTRTEIKNFPNHIYETFGMTETISHVALKHLSKNSQQDYFQTLNDITVEENKKGCLVINAPFFSEHPIVTNDMVEVKDSQHFKWLGRLDNAINSGGIKLIPEFLEKKIEHLFQQRFFLAGILDERLGEKMILIMEGETVALPQSERLKEKLKEHLDKHEIPREIKFSLQFSETANGKIRRKETLEKLKDGDTIQIVTP